MEIFMSTKGITTVIPSLPLFLHIAPHSTTSHHLAPL